MCEFIFVSFIFLIMLLSSFLSSTSSEHENETEGAGFVIYRRINPEIEYLMLKSSNGKELWSPPKGHVDPGEDDFFTTALRELREETEFTEDDLNIHMDDTKILKYVVKGEHKTVVYWLAEPIDAQKDPILSEEHTEFRWVSKENAIELVKEYTEFAELLDYFEKKIEKEIFSFKR